MTIRTRLFRLLEGLRTVQLWIAACALVLMMGVTVVDVFMRYLFNQPVRGSYDFVESTLVVVVFFGMATAFLHRRNIVIDLIDTFASERLIAILIRIADILSIAALALFAYAMIVPAQQAFSYGDRKLELQLPVFVLWAVALIGMAGTILCAFGALLRRPEPPGDERPPA